MQFQSSAREADGWETLSSTMRCDAQHATVYDVEVRSPAKPTGQRWTVVHRKPAVVIAALTDEGKLILINEERIPVQAALWSVPAGQIDEGQEIDEVVRRELLEETGYQLRGDGVLISLGHYFTSPGFTDERGHFFLARPVTLSADGPAHHESESILDCRAFAPHEIAAMIARNEIRDANTLSLCAVLMARGYLSLG